MIVCARGVLGGADISGSVERNNFSVEATFGARMDILKMNVNDPTLTLAFPDRAEIVIYDAPAGSAVTDPPFAISPYNTFRNGAGSEVTSPTPANWTPRIFAGYCATPIYTMASTERQIQVSAQDYTYRLRSTVVNQAFVAGSSDQSIVQTIFAKYRPDFDTTNVQLIQASMPAISFPVHSLEQFMQRVIKVSRAVYRVDYFKRLFYGPIGQVTAPFNLSDVPDGITTFGYEHASYSPDVSSLSDKVWVVGNTFLSAQQAYTIPVSLVNGSNYQFPLPGSSTKVDITSVTVGGVGKTIGQAPGDGDVASQSTFKTDCLIQTNPAVIAFAVTPPNATTVVVTGKFRYPLIQSYADPALVAAAGGLLFEAVVRDRRINDLALAQQVAKAYLANQGLTMKGLSLTCMQRSLGNVLLAPGQVITVNATRLFTGLGGPLLSFIITRTHLILDEENDLDHPYRFELEMVDHAVTGGY